MCWTPCSAFGPPRDRGPAVEDRWVNGLVRKHHYITVSETHPTAELTFCFSLQVSLASKPLPKMSKL